jgi:hypothetical protein
MTETDWAEESETPPKKRGIPRWAWIGCGCGCLVTIIVLVVGGIMIKRAFDEGTDPEVQWPRLGEVLPFDERPTDLEMQFGLSLGIGGVQNYTLRDDEDGYIVTVQHHGAANANEMDMLFSAEGGAIPFGIGEPVDAEERTLELQGREVRALSFRTIKGQGSVEELGPGIRIDSTRGAGFTFVEIRMIGTQEPVSDETISDFFDHFDLWGDG